MSYDREQKLIDICFQIAMTAREHHADFADNEAVAVWVAEQLRECGFPTTPVGASWGVLQKEKLCQQCLDITISTVRRSG